MKKGIFTLLAVAFFTLSSLAQNPGFQRPTPEQRVAAIHQKLDSAFNISAQNLAVLDTALTILYRQQDEKIKEMFSGGERPDRETMMAEFKKYSDSRDAMIKT
ncbi:MAG: hypothetical protein KDB92_01740, partial [Chitinophagaceae bacterium]|nr:hypothetical protein [Chitinophagaceae bacterium]